ncbi:acyl-CoA dehydrogenase [Curvivirga aplysinae]|uniref:acyl-CoA dehydrogenase n=1 Tax=Curvivirga aplysinae TaxID=2529852 RepID=UPI0012BCDCFC|nr:acyl-CoA dehydrogenase [Curvivirga aplysinae]MTI10432.1 acyl-CoA dehydrogenase [Curvivirga aplysinae]
MTEYNAPLKDMNFLLNDMGLLKELSEMPATAEATPDLVSAILDEGAKLAKDFVGACNVNGDEKGALLDDGHVKLPAGFKEAYDAYKEGAWHSLTFPEEHGGQGLPNTVGNAIHEMLESANMAWSLCPLLSQGAIKAIMAHGSQELIDTYVPKMISGEWTGTMNLTEASAGSDLSQVRTKATPNGDHYLISGQKIFITYGDHDQADNIVHLVLARLPDAPEGTRGISLFLVPKFTLNEDGTPGERNDAWPIKVEHKLGIHGSPTCIMSYGENSGAIGYLIGNENEGLKCMFTMMNDARLAVGTQGLSIAEMAYQRAVAYAKDRKQGRSELDGSKNTAIINHADVRRTLMTMRAYIEAMRALNFRTMVDLDIAENHNDPEWTEWADRRIGLITPVVKAWFTDLGVEIASMGIQIHGGMGFIEETGAAQYYRDARILPIYEGTNGIQAADLVGRKIIHDGGTAVREYLDEADSLINHLNGIEGEDMSAMRAHLAAGIDTLDRAVDWLMSNSNNTTAIGASSTYILKIFGLVAGGIGLARSMDVALSKINSGEGDQEFYKAKVFTARFYAENLLSQAPSILSAVREGHNTIRSIPDEMF